MIGPVVIPLIAGTVIALLIVAANLRATKRLDRERAISNEFQAAEQDAKRSTERAVVIRHTPKGRES